MLKKLSHQVEVQESVDKTAKQFFLQSNSSCQIWRQASAKI